MDKISAYQIFLRVFGNKNTTNKFYGTLSENGTGKFGDMDTKTLKSLKKFGVTHVWYTGVVEHATMTDFSEYGIAKDHPQVVKGIAGSPYAIKDYYDVNPYLADDVTQRMAEFEALVKRTQRAGLKALIDFVPNHVARQYKSDVKPAGATDFGEKDNPSVAFSPSNNFYYIPGQAFGVPDGVNPPVAFEQPYAEYPAKATGNDVFSATPSINDWFETVKLNYGVDYVNGRRKYFDPVPPTWNQMLDILNFWAAKGVDGFRCDMAEMVPVEFWHWVIPKVKARHPEVIFIAEIYNPAEYRNYLDYGNFDYLYDKVGLYDALRRLIEGHGNAMDISAVWQNESGHFSRKMLRFLENHDEQRIASDEFGKTPESAYAAMMLSATLHTGPVMIYAGQEFGVKPDRAEGFQGDDGRTTIFDFWGLPEVQSWWATGSTGEKTAAVRNYYERLLHFIQKNEAVYAGEFHDLQYLNGQGQSPGYDERTHYSYLRFSAKQCLLFVYNFDLEKERKFSLKLPRQVFKEGRIRMKLKPVFEPGQKTEVEAETEIRMEVTVPPNGFSIWEIEVK
ncbi:MAG: alpha-amylase family protein [Leadbetterella sp.]|nr:alpha-amylase family protein [Leadbetterella sp.]